MSNSFNHKKINFIINIAYISVIVFIIYIFLKYLLGVIIPFLFSIILSYIAEPFIRILTEKTKLKRPLCSGLCITVILLLIVCVLIFLSIVICSQFETLINAASNYISDISRHIDRISLKSNTNFFEKILLQLKEYILAIDINTITESGLTNRLILYFANIFKSLPKFLMAIIVSFTFSVFLSSSLPKIKSFMLSVLSEKKSLFFKNIKSCILNISKQYFKSYSILMFITFIELAIAFYLFKINPPIPLALIISFIDILPVFGVGTVLIPWGLICIISGDYSMAAAILSIYAVITIVRQMIEPKIVGQNIGLPPVITLPVMFIGFSIFGITGLFAGPIIATIVYDLHIKGYIRLWK